LNIVLKASYYFPRYSTSWMPFLFLPSFCYLLLKCL